MIPAIRVVALCAMLLTAFNTFAQTKTDVSYAQETARSKALLNKAVSFYREHKDSALPVFSRQGEFIDQELYVYVVNTQGVLLASGGPSVILVGREISNLLDQNLKTAFHQALTAPEGEVHEADYRWVNPDDGKVEPKHTYYQRIGDRVLAVGYYLPRSNPDQAKNLLDAAAKAVVENPSQTYQAINNLDRSFFQDDLYVFVVDLKSNQFVAHGYNRRLVGTDFKGLLSADGKPIGQSMLDAVNSEGKGEFEYLWRNPVTGRTEHKHTYLRKVGNDLVAVGYYSRK